MRAVVLARDSAEEKSAILLMGRCLKASDGLDRALTIPA